MPINIPESNNQRIVIVGAGFAGLTLAKKLIHSDYQIVLIDKNNFHQFQPLFYQVAMAGLEPSSIAFPLRKVFQKRKNIHIRVAEVQEIKSDENRIITNLGYVNFDHLVLCYGAETKFFGSDDFKNYSFGLKSISESLHLRNAILDDLEKALTTRDYDERQGYIDIVIVGGGATGVEMAGALAEMKKYILHKDYKELNAAEVDIYLIQSGDRLLKSMSKKSSEAAEKCLKDLGVHVMKNRRVTQLDSTYVYTNTGDKIRANKVVWAAGIECKNLQGIPESSVTWGNRLIVDQLHRIEGMENIYAIGDLAFMTTIKYPEGHPQVAQTAIQQAKNLASNLMKRREIKFEYRDLGTLATIGRNKAVADLPNMSMKGFLAWLIWLFVHLRNLLGVKNKIFVLINWFWNYVTYDQSLRLIIKPFSKRKENV